MTLGPGSWYLGDALNGNSASDRKIGAYSTRVRSTGKVRMIFDLTSAGTVAVTHALYGTDTSSSGSV